MLAGGLGLLSRLSRLSPLFCLPLSHLFLFTSSPLACSLLPFFPSLLPSLRLLLSSVLPFSSSYLVTFNLFSCLSSYLFFALLYLSFLLLSHPSYPFQAILLSFPLLIPLLSCPILPPPLPIYPTSPIPPPSILPLPSSPFYPFPILPLPYIPFLSFLPLPSSVLSLLLSFPSLSFLLIRVRRPHPLPLDFPR